MLLVYALLNEDCTLTFRLEQAVNEESRGESNLQAEGPNYNLSGKLTEYSNTYKVQCVPLLLTSLAVILFSLALKCKLS